MKKRTKQPAMIQTPINLRKDQRTALTAHGKRCKMSMAEVVRSAVDAHLGLKIK